MNGLRAHLRILLTLVLAVANFQHSARAQNQTDLIRPGDRWLDDRGIEIQAHGGGILHLADTWYWFGEDRSQTNDPTKRYVACYSSTDLVHWEIPQPVLAISDPENIGRGFILERPKVFYNAHTQTFVLYKHLDDSSYKLASVAIAVSKKIDGDYSYVKSFRPLDQESRDIGQFIDDDGSAYLIFESRPSKGFFIAKLSGDYMTVGKQMSFVNAPLEGGTIVHFNNLYYVVGSHLTGWSPNPNVYATAPGLSGPWSNMQNIAPIDTNTYNSQSSMLVKVAGTKSTAVIYIGDRWTPATLWDSRYIWMPIEIVDGKLSLPQPQPWKIDTHTGITTIVPNVSP